MRVHVKKTPVSKCGSKCPLWKYNGWDQPKCKGTGKLIAYRLKTFPRSCPLKKMEPEENDE
jgi:hypothetical protein